MLDIIKNNKKLLFIHLGAGIIFLGLILITAILVGYYSSQVNYLERDLNNCLASQKIN